MGLMTDGGQMAIIEALAGKDPIVETNERHACAVVLRCVFCDRSSTHSILPEDHEIDCVWLQAHRHVERVTVLEEARRRNEVSWRDRVMDLIAEDDEYEVKVTADNAFEVTCDDTIVSIVIHARRPRS